ncbi:MAG: Holliday junction resolvase RuvX [Vampirovibrionales bacterium]|nr:Holliday junction resolvase RuvX [Vampirovibrionales bacterium]
MKPETPLLALDIGKRRIGLAISEPETNMALALPTLDLKAQPPVDLMAHVQALCRRYEVSELVIGLPLSMDGVEGSQAQWVREVSEKLCQATKLPITFVDERLSSAQAARGLQSANLKPSRHKPLIDAEAARLLLESELRRREISNPA